MIKSNESNESNKSNESTYNNCIEIINNKNTYTASEMNSKYSVFRQKYPRLFQMLTESNQIDYRILKFLCDKADEQNALNLVKTEENKDKQLTNDLEVGDYLAKKYIYNKVAPEPSEEEKQKIKEQIREKLNNN